MAENTQSLADIKESLVGLGERIALARKRRGLTQAQLAQRMQSTPRTLYRLERGDGTVSLSLLARALDVLELRDLDLVAANDAVGAWAAQARPPKRVRGKNKLPRVRQRARSTTSVFSHELRMHRSD